MGSSHQLAMLVSALHGTARILGGCARVRHCTWLLLTARDFAVLKEAGVLFIHHAASRPLCQSAVG